MVESLFEEEICVGFVLLSPMELSFLFAGEEFLLVNVLSSFRSVSDKLCFRNFEAAARLDTREFGDITGDSPKIPGTSVSSL